MLYFGHAGASKILPKTDEKMRPHGNGPKVPQHTQHSPKMAPEMDSPFSRIWSKMDSTCDMDAKMAPREAMGPQDETQKPQHDPEMTQK